MLLLYRQISSVLILCFAAVTLIGQATVQPYQIHASPVGKYLAFEDIRGNSFLAQYYRDSTYIYLASDAVIPAQSIDVFTSQADSIQWKSNGKYLEAVRGDRNLLSYATEVIPPADTLPSYYERSGFIHPLNSPSGRTVTEGFPKGHVHQHGVFKAWTSTTYHDQERDFWNQAKEQGVIRHEKTISKSSGQVFSHLQTELGYYIVDSTQEKKIMTETWDLLLYNVEENTLLDIWTTDRLINADDSLTLNQYHYGGFAFRATDQWNRTPNYDTICWVNTSDDRNQIDGNHTRPRWVSMHGLVDGSLAGITIIPFRKNFHYPEYTRIHPSMPYFCFFPTLAEPSTLYSGDTLTAGYRLVVYDGTPDENYFHKLFDSQ